MPMVDVADFIRANGSINYSKLHAHAQKISSGEFSHLFRRPLLVGTAIYQGQLEEKKSVNQTMLFNIKNIEELSEASEESKALQSAIFPIHKRLRGDSKPNIVSVGRSNENDLVLNDYPVSRVHAQIRIKLDHFFLMDLNATNGTTINEKQLPPHAEVEIAAGDTVGFGRYRFHLLSPSALHKRLTANQ
ncbi:MAG: FHA domain-containing protein [Agarilytica sp.]